jgi:hypothetical protein
MLSFKSKLQLGLLSIALLGLAVAMPVRGEEKEVKEEPGKDAELDARGQKIAALATANKLLEYGLAKKRPEAVATAIIMTVHNNLEDTDEKSLEMIKAGLTESLDKANDFKAAGAYKELLDKAKEAISEFKTKGVKGGAQSFAGNVANGQNVKIGNGFVYNKNAWGAVTVKNVRPGNNSWVHVVVRRTGGGAPIVAENWGSSVYLTWWVGNSTETYNIWVYHYSGGKIDFVGYTN